VHLGCVADARGESRARTRESAENALDAKIMRRVRRWSRCWTATPCHPNRRR
jgi:hypothetical protein